MSSILDLLTQQLGGSGVEQISRQLGTNETTAAKAVPAALGALMGALAKNSSRGEGAKALLGALERDHDGSVLDNLSGYLDNPRDDVGSGILGHVFGGRRGAVEAGLGQAVGLDSQSSAKLLAMLAPLVMGALGKARQQRQLDAGALTSMLEVERKTAETNVPGGAGLLGALLDQDGDGQIADDIAKIGGGLLKNLLGRR